MQVACVERKLSPTIAMHDKPQLFGHRLELLQETLFFPIKLSLDTLLSWKSLWIMVTFLYCFRNFAESYKDDFKYEISIMSLGVESQCRAKIFVGRCLILMVKVTALLLIEAMAVKQPVKKYSVTWKAVSLLILINLLRILQFTFVSPAFGCTIVLLWYSCYVSRQGERTFVQLYCSSTNSMSPNMEKGLLVVTYAQNEYVQSEQHPWHWSIFFDITIYLVKSKETTHPAKLK